MKKLAILSCAALALFACKNKASNNPETAPVAEVESSKQITYAELSKAVGGEWADGPRGHKEYLNGTFQNIDSLTVPEEHTDHSWYLRYEGPGWENAQVGYRLYLDWRNAIDIFGKKVDTLVLPQVGQNGFDSYHDSSPWGMDILKAGKSMGIGGYGRVVADTVVHFQNVKSTFASVENASAVSSVNIEYTGWESGEDTIDLTSKLSIFPSDRFTKAELTPSKAITGLCTGIVNHDVALHKKVGSKWAYIATYGVQTLNHPADKLGMALFYKVDEVETQKLGKDDHLVIFKPTTETVTYYFLAAWEKELKGITNEADFLSDINSKLSTLEANGALE
ncbi:glycoside hydrolase [Tamlana nanhaiensis]|uniref:Glycoside hydrolase n=1 Tax=Neotamlana nanhaiensis TaxID=1382798 RepID=A0A0D7VWB8_9FLAO|nr:DUF4861 family protein [Tamlana nanhaiensis]KJD31094.1 glycoside hydrolase [Tamlana nanhaiensis]